MLLCNFICMVAMSTSPERGFWSSLPSLLRVEAGFRHGLFLVWRWLWVASDVTEEALHLLVLASVVWDSAGQDNRVVCMHFDLNISLA